MLVGGVETREGGWRETTACGGVVDIDNWVRAGVLYPRVGAVADYLTGLGQVTRHDCSVSC